ncbi:hypothetical protein OEB99_07280 [Actinotalea sp. M2MS4P-6]|uniref:hypothetical protein n=1 Tax=Actinotalea sp. M2MS4P-6 TaxID=2983762 RepID=UPI0021E3E1C2|nr:hypothetical protein [Actinotalea sp. M2MS4P-6]MCV2394103.1 hypothetical protein [Actinotalea sp. M2MS4P-6]
MGRIRAISVEIAVLGIIVSSAVPAAAAPTIGTVPRSPVAVSGTVQRDGRGVPADVVVVAWPDQEFLADLADGERVPLVTVALARASGNGSFVARVDPAALPAEYVAADGQVNLEVTAADAASQMTWNVSVRADATSSGATAWHSAKVDAAPAGAEPLGAAAVATSSAPRMVFDLGTGVVLDSTTPLDSFIDVAGQPLTEAEARDSLTTGVVGRDRRTDLAVRAGADAVASGVVVPMEPICDVVAVGWVYGVTEYFTHVQGASFANVKVTQGYESSHTLGIAYSGAGGGGTWTAGGSQTIKLGASGTSPAYTDARRMANKVNYRKYQNTCTGQITLRPASIHTILSNQTYTTRRTYSYACVSYKAGQTFTKTRGTNLTVSGGVKLPNISVNAQSGFNSLSSATWTWTKSGKLCANSNLGTATATGVGTMY